MLKTLFLSIKNRWPIIIFLILYFIFSYRTYKDYGLTMDEFFVYTRGQYFYTKVRGNDPLLQKGFVINEGDNQNLLFYNSSYPAILYAFNKDKSYETYHFINLLVTSSIFCLIFEVLLFIYKEPLLAILGPIFLFFTPRYLGAIPANPKDIPFSIFYFISLIFMFFSSSWNEKLRILLLGLLIGIASSIRFIGFSLIIIYWLNKLLIYFSQNKKITFIWLINSLIELFLIFSISFLVFMLNMPYIASDPFNHLLELVNINKKYPWNGEIMLFGEKFTAQQRPDLYLFIWVFITTPIYILFLSVTSFFKKVLPEIQRLIHLITLSIVIQLIFYFIFHPVVYNGLRHYLFLLPHLVLLASIMFIETLKNGKFKLILIVFTIINIFSILFFYIQSHPYEYVYFNSLIGGARKAQDKFELDYWAATDKEALLWLKDYLAKNNKIDVKVATCSKSESINYYLPTVINVNEKIIEADYIICHDYFMSIKIEKNPNISLIHTVLRDNIPLNHIYSQNHKRQ